MPAEPKNVRFPAEIGLLLAFCIFLPLAEAPKGISLLAYVIVWIVNRMRSGTVGGDWRGWDTLIVAWIGSAYLAALFPGLGGNAWSKTGDLATQTLILWLVMRAGYSEMELRWVLGTLVLSTIAGIAYGYWRIWTGAGKTGLLQLYSVGQVNHTAIYLAIMLGVCASWLFARWHGWRAGRRALALAVIALMLVAVAATTSRGALAVGFLLLLILAAAWWPRWRVPLAASVLAIAITSALLIGFNSGVVRKQIEYVATQKNSLSFRDDIWRMGIAAWEKYPWFGVGKDNYGQITHELVRGWRAQAGKDFDARLYMREPHAHSLYVNTLAERGGVGFAALAALLIAWLAALVRHRPRPADSDFAWLAWGGAASAWAVTAGVGVVNTTFHHEHGLLAALLLGLWLSTLRPRRESS
jgi:O-antigen ligase